MSLFSISQFCFRESRKMGWGSRSRWARRYFSDAVRQQSRTELSTEPTSASSVLGFSADCKRCGATIYMLPQPATGRPDFLACASHLEAPGACSQGVLRYTEDESKKSATSSPPQSLDDNSAIEALLDLVSARRRQAVGASKDVIVVAVLNPKTPANMGSVLRAMGCYGGSLVLYSGDRLDKAAKFATDTMTARAEVRQLHVDHWDSFLGNAKQKLFAAAGAALHVTAVELVDGAIPLPLYQHRPRLSGNDWTQSDGGLEHVDDGSEQSKAVISLYLFGPEDGTIPQDLLTATFTTVVHKQVQSNKIIDDVVFVPTVGSMNLAACVNVLLYDRCAKDFMNARKCSEPPIQSGIRPSDNGTYMMATRNANNKTHV